MSHYKILIVFFFKIIVRVQTEHPAGHPGKAREKLGNNSRAFPELPKNNYQIINWETNLGKNSRGWELW